MNDMVRSPQVGTRDGMWVWDGSRWVCAPDDPCDDGFRPPVVTPAFFPPPVFSGPTAQPPWYPGANGGVSFGQNFPPNPTRGHMFWDGKTFWLFDGAAWVDIGFAGAAGGGGGGGSGAGTVVISTTPPGNPQVGSQWWNGSQLQMWDGAKWVVIGPGSAAGPVPTTTVTFAIVQTGFFTAPTAWDILTITATPTVDTLLGWDPTTKKYRPNKAGFYLFEALFWASGLSGMALVKNDQGTFANDQNHPAIGIDTTTATGYLQIAATALMNGTTDFVRLFALSSSGQVWGNPSPPIMTAILLP